ncbi:hypothetical protein HHL25_01575 [Rhizobium sp. S-51]|uniref:Uncharacterized protein n=1 Tax=Rhizobium terricola TaxID=2728849 RepID=A0A7Y0ASR0_9HYPH|nr:hypothetical protein [Rhizobium terricola]NML72806.1 hypothetical protein [Rhizobium terricola]
MALAGRVIFTLLLFMVGNAASAETLPIDKSYGNLDGCSYAKTGESTGSDNFFLLTREAVTTAASYCVFGRIQETKDRSYMAQLKCEAEGEENATSLEADIVLGAEGYTISFPDNPDMKWGPLAECN